VDGRGWGWLKNCLHLLSAPLVLFSLPPSRYAVLQRERERTHAPHLTLSVPMNVGGTIYSWLDLHLHSAPTRPY
jgi:hypothetical protein